MEEYLVSGVEPGQIRWLGMMLTPFVPICRSSGSATRCSRCRSRWRARSWPRGSAPITAGTLGWILAAMVSARSAAMGFNRLVDARMDALNPRTSNRELPRGAMSIREAALFVVVASIAFAYSSWRLSPLCFTLSPVALAIVFWYSLAKRYTTWTQMFLGLAMAVAPVGGWLAVGGRGGWEPWLLALAIGTWVGGFDVLYACQDVDFDRAHGLRSIPVRFGVAALAHHLARHARRHRCVPARAAAGDAAAARVRSASSWLLRCWCTNSHSSALTTSRRSSARSI